MITINLALTSSAPPKYIKTIWGGQNLVPVNVASGGVACTLNTRYDGLSETTDIITLAHYPKTVVLIEYDL